MKRLKNLWAVLLAAMLAMTMFACGTKEKTNDASNSQKNGKRIVQCSADYPEYASVGELSTQAEYVVRGTVLSEQCESMSLKLPESGEDSAQSEQDDEKTVVTVYEIRVNESYSGAAGEGDVLKVMLLGGENEDTVYQYPDNPEIKINSEYVFFLDGSQIVENGAWLLNNTQALYSIDGETVSKTAGQGFSLSFEELKALKAE